ncbi:MAG TPA: hypothetical protein VME17_08870 [Bryobacteraceae bacterium]|nr:hypothetical protein [Bryobacteraceae bacterium]
MSGLKQPVLGVVSTALVMVVSLAFIHLFSFALFAGWIATFLLSLIPMEIVMGVTWGMREPRFVAERPQPVRGILYSLLALIAGVIVVLVHWVVVGTAISPPTPIYTQCMIASVVIMFWLAIVWGGWPFSAFIKNPIAVGIALMIACYAINYIFFRLMFNFDFLRHAPGYVASQDPHGWFNATTCVVMYVTGITPMFLTLCFDLWPFTKSKTLMKQPVLGIVWTAVCLAIGFTAYYIGVGIYKMDPQDFLTEVPIPFLFGTIFMLNMLQNSVFAKFQQPLKGVLNMLAAAICGNAFSLMYRALEPSITGKIETGPPAYQSEIWLASALLSVTFPFLVAYVDFFTMWPLQRATTEKVMETATGR